MKTTILLFCLQFTMQANLFAQKGQPKFGKVDLEDLKMVDCDFDKGADALALIDYGNIYYDRGTVGFSAFKTVYNRRVRIKILKEKGLSEADVEIPFFTHNNEERVLDISANTYNLDGSGKMVTTSVKKSSLYTKKIDGDYSKMVITFPEVKVGSIIEYSYSIERETYNLRNWYFQGRIPVRYSEYQIKVPQIFRFSVQPSVIDPIEDKQEIITESISLDESFIETKVLKSNYVMRNLPGIKNEPFMGSARDYMQRLEFQMTQIYYDENRVVDLSLTWKDVIKNSLKEDEDFGKQLNKNVPKSNALVNEARTIVDTEQRMKFIYEHIRKEMSWNGEFGIYTNDGIVTAWENRSGNSADINMLLINLLNDAGIKTYPILLSTRDHGLVTQLYPFLNQFNTVLGYIEIGDRYFVLDATDKVSHYTMVSDRVINTSGFIVIGENGKWKDILAGKFKYKVMAAAQGQVDESGNLTGNVLVNCYDYARVKRCRAINDNREKFKEEYFIKAYPSLKIEEIIIKNADADSLPLEQKIKFSTVLSNSGDYRYFSTNLFSDLEKNPFISNTRIADVDFGVAQEFIIFGNYTIPVGYSFDGIPENFSMTTSDKGIVFNRYMQVEGNLLNVRMNLDFKRSFYPANTYSEFKEFYKKLFDKLNEQVVIKKKANP